MSVILLRVLVIQLRSAPGKVKDHPSLRASINRVVQTVRYSVAFPLYFLLESKFVIIKVKEMFSKSYVSSFKYVNFDPETIQIRCKNEPAVTIVF